MKPGSPVISRREGSQVTSRAVAILSKFHISNLKPNGGCGREQLHLNYAGPAHDQRFVRLEIHAPDKLAAGGQLIDIVDEIQDKGSGWRAAYLIPVTHLHYLSPAANCAFSTSNTSHNTPLLFTIKGMFCELPSDLICPIIYIACNMGKLLSAKCHYNDCPSE